MPDEANPVDFNKMLDLDRTTLTRNFVDRLEAIMREQQAARDDLKGILAEMHEAEFRKHDIAAAKKIAKLRLEDKLGDAREQLEALDALGEPCLYEGEKMGFGGMAFWPRDKFRRLAALRNAA